MKIVHICLAGLYMSGWGYQDNMIAKYHMLDGASVTVIANKYVYDKEGNYVRTDASTEYDETVREAYSELLDVHPDMKKVSDAAKACGSRYVILKTGLWPDVPLENYGYTLIMQNDELNVYESTEEADAP